MADELTLVNRQSDPIDFIVADGTGIEKGTLLNVSDPRTAAAASANDNIAGVAAAEKIASDGRTRLAVFRNGIFEANCSGAAVVGDLVAASDDNFVKAAGSGLSGAQIIGTFLETASDGERVQVDLRIGGCTTLA